MLYGTYVSNPKHGFTFTASNDEGAVDFVCNTLCPAFELDKLELVEIDENNTLVRRVLSIKGNTRGRKSKRRFVKKQSRITAGEFIKQAGEDLLEWTNSDKVHVEFTLNVSPSGHLLYDKAQLLAIKADMIRHVEPDYNED